MSSAYNNSFRNRTPKDANCNDVEAGTQLIPQGKSVSKQGGIITTFFNFLKNGAIVGESCTESQGCSCRFCKANDYLIEKDQSHLHFLQKMVDEEQQSVLHYAANCESSRMGLFAAAKTFSLGDKQKLESNTLYKFANIRDGHGKTALHYALQKRNKDLISLLLRNYADINLLSDRDRTQAANLVCTGIHKELIYLFDSHLKVTEDHINPSNELMWTVDYDFAPVVGAYDRFEEQIHQTKNLATWLRRSSTDATQILLHPMMQIFLNSKGERFLALRYISIFYHVLFYILWVLFAFCEAAKANVSYIQNKVDEARFDLRAKGADANEEDQLEFQALDDMLTKFNAQRRNLICADGVDAVVGPATLSIFFLVNVGKELLELYMSDERRYYWKQWQNIFQWLLYVPFLGLLFNSNENIETLYFIISIFVAMALVQDQLAKIPILKINTDVFAKGLINVIRMGIAFIPFLTAFTVTFNLLLPLNPQFGLFGYSKITAMLTGELNFDDVFYPDGEKSDKISHFTLAKIWFLIFTVVIVILFQNLVLATIIKDVQGLQSEAKSNDLATRFDDIYLTEHFLMHPISQRLLSFVCLKAAAIRLLSVERRHGRSTENGRGKCTGKRLDEFPRDLRTSIQEWHNNKKNEDIMESVTRNNDENVRKDESPSSAVPVPRPRHKKDAVENNSSNNEGYICVWGART